MGNDKASQQSPKLHITIHLLHRNTRFWDQKPSKEPCFWSHEPGFWPTRSGTWRKPWLPMLTWRNGEGRLELITFCENIQMASWTPCFQWTSRDFIPTVLRLDCSFFWDLFAKPCEHPHFRWAVSLGPPGRGFPRSFFMSSFSNFSRLMDYYHGFIDCNGNHDNHKCVYRCHTHMFK